MPSSPPPKAPPVLTGRTAIHVAAVHHIPLFEAGEGGGYQPVAVDVAASAETSEEDSTLERFVVFVWPAVPGAILTEVRRLAAEYSDDIRNSGTKRPAAKPSPKARAYRLLIDAGLSIDVAAARFRQLSEEW